MIVPRSFFIMIEDSVCILLLFDCFLQERMSNFDSGFENFIAHRMQWIRLW